MDRFTLIAIIAGAVGLVLTLLVIARRTHLRGEGHWKLWSLVAQRLGGAMRPRASSVLAADELAFSAVVDDVVVDVIGRRVPKALRRNSERGTEICAEVKGAQGLEVVISSKHDKTRGRRVVDTNNVDLTTAWLSSHIRELLNLCPPYRFVLSGDRVVATREGLETDAEMLGHATTTVAQLALGGREVLRRVKTMTAEIGGVLSARSDVWEPGGGVLSVVDRQGSQVLIDFVQRAEGESRDQRIFTRIRVRPLMTSEAQFVIHGHRSYEPPAELSHLPLVSPADVDFSRNFTILTDDELGFSERLSTTVREKIIGLHPALVTSDGREVTVLLNELVTDAMVVSEALELATELVAAGRP